MIRLATTLALLCAIASHAWSQEAPSQARLQAAESLLDGMGMEQVLQQNAEGMLKLQLEQNPGLAQFEDIMREFMGQALNWQELKPQFVALYAEAFTADELRQLLAFYRTPLGQRVLATMSEINIRSADIGQQRMQALIPQMSARMMERAAALSTEP